ncbi:acyl-coenzyme A thioesterase THEM5 isoform X3 [Choloepus didactylus]|uniref:acyl-coenzyme A thioesterase THEM5 isoform X3 n=1 Tax=Choloepus didactylus TaxID=27675 RepID=UPI00189DA8CD|nr:acyl-coenzyme A thioesterase THEM5 isoform X3 [Choloepus didactylus]
MHPLCSAYLLPQLHSTAEKHCSPLASQDSAWSPPGPSHSAMLRRGFQAAARLGYHRVLPGGRCILPRLNPASAFGSSTDSLVSRFCPEKTDFKDYALPNASWCPDMLSLYKEFMEKTKSSGWVKLPSFKSNREHIQGLKLPSGLAVPSDKRDWRSLTRCIQVEGQGYEYVIFFHPSEKKSVCLFQPGPYLEGPPGLAHGGALAAMMDETFSKTAYLTGEGLLTLSLNIRFKNCFPSAAAGRRVIPTVVTMPAEAPTTDHLACLGPTPEQEGVPRK